MIELVNVSKYYPTDFGRHYVFQDVSLVLPLDKSVGVLGPNGAGKSTFLRLIGGADMPSEGSIFKTGRISPPMGLTPGLQNSLTGVENARFAGRIHGMDRDAINDMIEYVRELSGIGKYFDMPVGTYSAGMKQRVAFAVNMSMNFDYYLFDEISAGGDKEFRKITRALVQERLETSKFIIASHRFDELLDICDAGILIQNGELAFFDDIKDALKAYGEDDEKIDRKTERSRKRKSRDNEGEALTVNAGEVRGAKRAERRQRREQKEDETAAAAIDAGAQPGAEAIPAILPAAEDSVDGAARREKRRQRKATKLPVTDTATTAAESELPAPEIAAIAGTEQVIAPPGEAGSSGDRKKRRQRRAVKARGSENADPGLTAELSTMDAAAEARRQSRLAAKAAAAESAGDKLSTEAEVTAAVEQPVTVLVQPDEIPSRRLLRRQERLRARQEAENSATDEPPAEARAAPAVEESAMALPDSRVSQPPAPRPHVPPAGDGQNRFALQRALFRQDRAQVKAARASRLLQQHLEERLGAPSAADSIRAALVTAAQEAAAQEAALARQIVESFLSGDQAINDI